MRQKEKEVEQLNRRIDAQNSQRRRVARRAQRDLNASNAEGREEAKRRHEADKRSILLQTLPDYSYVCPMEVSNQPTGTRPVIIVPYRAADSSRSASYEIRLCCASICKPKYANTKKPSGTSGKKILKQTNDSWTRCKSSM